MPLNAHTIPSSYWFEAVALSLINSREAVNDLLLFLISQAGDPVKLTIFFSDCTANH